MIARPAPTGSHRLAQRELRALQGPLWVALVLRERHWHFETGRLQTREIANAISPSRFERMPQPEFPTDYSWMRSELSRRYLQFKSTEPYSLLGELPKTLELEKDTDLGPDHVNRRCTLDDPGPEHRSGPRPGDAERPYTTETSTR
jgi:hypothetical protein